MKKIIILGGGFCGALAAKKLNVLPDFQVILIDKKNYFEYTPSIHRIIFDSKYHKKIIVPFKNFLKRTRIVTDKLLEVTEKHVKTAKETLNFDYLIVCTGIDYPVFLENKTNVYTLKSGSEATRIGKYICKSKNLLIVGGGLVGTEITGELITKAPKVNVTLVHPKERLLERNPVKASTYAENFLKAHNVKIIFGERVKKHKGKKTYLTDKGKKIVADTALWCAGIRYNPWFMKNKEKFCDERSALKVNNYLQLEGTKNIFVGGDINNVKEEKTAQNAERHAHTIVRNILCLERKETLKKYIPKSAPLVISLGDHNAILTLPNKKVITGRLPALIKHAIEKLVLSEYKTSIITPISKVFAKMVDLFAKKS
ncbi:hypothetical protein COV18_05975 [Candidatus Woesearchaeota archaeon CG10_big_fil_rev_8_21_14_0_10_37_12]|nr:MAG: hypothetical protein COV18_05975 [Candidatus Woesearchaeota archaeon CG10_big_fil_rev_8_21_14_0_10_37_12]